jgi:hypothetical protein
MQIWPSKFHTLDHGHCSRKRITPAGPIIFSPGTFVELSGKVSFHWFENWTLGSHHVQKVCLKVKNKIQQNFFKKWKKVKGKERKDRKRSESSREPLPDHLVSGPGSSRVWNLFQTSYLTVDLYSQIWSNCRCLSHWVTKLFFPLSQFELSFSHLPPINSCLICK